MDKPKVLKRHFYPGAEWFEISLQDCLIFTEQARDAHQPGTVEARLRAGEIVRTQFAEYKLVAPR